MKIPTVWIACFLLSVVAPAAAETPLTPYAGEQTRAIKAISDADISALRARYQHLRGYGDPAGSPHRHRHG